jgi:hypothetical protein
MNFQVLPIYVILFLVVIFLPNSQEWLRYKPLKRQQEKISAHQCARRLSPIHCFIGGMLFFISTKPLFEDAVFEFLYYNF